MRLFVDSALRSVAYADASGNFSFPLPGLTAGSKIELFAQSSSTACVSNSATRTVQIFTTPPVITTDNAGYVALGATSLTGTSSEVNSTIVYVYKRVGSTTTFVGQTTVTSGAWTLSSIPATAATDIYAATQQAPGNALSDTSNLALVPTATTNSCATFSASSYPANAASLTGTVSPTLTSGKVYLYIDGALADSATSVTTAFTINVNTTAFNTIYAGATLTLTAKTSGGSEKLGCGAPSTATVTCSTIPTPSFTLNPSTITINNSTTAQVTGAVSGLLYTLIGSPDNGISYGNAAFATGTSLNLPSYDFTNTGTYPLTVRAVNLNEGSNCVTTGIAASLIVNNTPLPVHLIYFRANLNEQGQAVLEWSAYDEKNLLQYLVERSTDGRAFTGIGQVGGAGSRGAANTYSYTDAEILNGKAWYRLRVAEADGTFSYSPAASVSAGQPFTAPRVMPVPFRESITISQHAAEPGQSTVRLLDITGRVCVSRSYTLKK
jgi:hypothetical protein